MSMRYPPKAQAQYSELKQRNLMEIKSQEHLLKLIDDYNSMVRKTDEQIKKHSNRKKLMLALITISMSSIVVGAVIGMTGLVLLLTSIAIKAVSFNQFQVTSYIMMIISGPTIIIPFAYTACRISSSFDNCTEKIEDLKRDNILVKSALDQLNNGIDPRVTYR